MAKSYDTKEVLGIYKLEDALRGKVDLMSPSGIGIKIINKDGDSITIAPDFELTLIGGNDFD